jgi:hypothetical protein
MATFWSMINGYGVCDLAAFSLLFPAEGREFSADTKIRNWVESAPWPRIGGGIFDRFVAMAVSLMRCIGVCGMLCGIFLGAIDEENSDIDQRNIRYG